MPHLHFHIFLFIDRIWALLATGATNFSNKNVLSGNRLIEDLNMTHHKKAVQVLRALVEEITLHQSQGTPIIVQALVTMKYCPMSAISSHWPQPAAPTTSPPDNANHRDIKRNPATPVGGNEKDANKLPNKK